MNNSDPSGLWPGESLVHDVLDVVATPPYAQYYGAYQIGRAINKVGCSLGGVGCAVSHALVGLTPIPELEAIGLGEDAGIDQLKIWLGVVPPSYGICDEGQNIPCYQEVLITAVPPFTMLPVSASMEGIDFEW